MSPQNLSQTERGLMTRRRVLAEKKKKIGPNKERIGFGLDLVMKLAAVFFDILGALFDLIPFIGGVMSSILSIAGDMCIGLGYLFLGVKPLAEKTGGSGAVKRSFIVRILCFLLELIPYANILPGFSIAVWYTNGAVKKEDKEYNNRMRQVRKEVEQEEKALQRDMQQFGMMRENQETEYNNQQYEAETNQVYDNDQEDSIAA